MNDVLLLHFTPATRPEIPAITDGLRSAMPGIELKIGECIIPGPGSLDSFRNQYDVGYLIKQIPKSELLSLWLISEDVFAPGKLYVFGAALGRKAIVSNFMLDSLRSLISVTVHEIYHMLGLSHCNGPCAMKEVRSNVEAAARPPYLCDSCRMKLLELNEAKESAPIKLRR